MDKAPNDFRALNPIPGVAFHVGDVNVPHSNADDELLPKSLADGQRDGAKGALHSPAIVDVFLGHADEHGSLLARQISHRQRYGAEQSQQNFPPPLLGQAGVAFKGPLQVGQSFKLAQR
jgi:hypothetical protein